MSTLNDFKEYQIYYEHTLTNYDHSNGTNEYIFNYPDHWIQYPSKQHIVALRAVSITPAARDFFIHDIKLRRNGIDKEIFEVDISSRIYLGCDEDMGKLNNKLSSCIYDAYREYKDEIQEARISSTETKSYLGCRDYTMFYVQSDNSFVFRILSTNIENPFYFFFNEATSYTSDDFKYMVGLKDDNLFKYLSMFQGGHITKTELNQYLKTLPNVEIKFMTSNDSDTRITDMIFKNVWNRSNLIVGSTLSSLSENRYLTLSNISHNPPKMYDINGYNSKFAIYLHDPSSKQDIELPIDRKDIITVETILIAK